MEVLRSSAIKIAATSSYLETDRHPAIPFSCYNALMEFLMFVVAGMSLAWVILLHGRVKAVERIMDSMCDNQRSISDAVRVMDQRVAMMERSALPKHLQTAEQDSAE